MFEKYEWLINTFLIGCMIWIPLLLFILYFRIVIILLVGSILCGFLYKSIEILLEKNE